MAWRGVRSGPGGVWPDSPGWWWFVKWHTLKSRVCFSSGRPGGEGPWSVCSSLPVTEQVSTCGRHPALGRPAELCSRRRRGRWSRRHAESWCSQGWAPTSQTAGRREDGRPLLFPGQRLGAGHPVLTHLTTFSFGLWVSCLCPARGGGHSAPRVAWLQGGALRGACGAAGAPQRSDVSGPELSFPKKWGWRGSPQNLWGLDTPQEALLV